MNTLKNLVCANGFMIFCYVFDAILILAAISLFVWYYFKSSKMKSEQFRKDVSDEKIAKIDDDTYLVATDEEQKPVEVVNNDNAVEHFVNQITGINEQVNAELNSNAIVVNHEVEQPVKRVPRKDEIQNYVMIGGAKKEKTESEIRTSYNTCSDAFKKSTDFLNTIKQQTVETAEKKPAAAPKKKTTK